jgi:hypothetical protein
MNATREPGRRPASAGSIVRRFAAAMIMSAMVFVLLWLMAFSLFTSLLASAGCWLVVVAASTVFDVVEMVLDAIAAVIFGVLAAIAAVFAAILGLFGM